MTRNKQYTAKRVADFNNRITNGIKKVLLAKVKAKWDAKEAELDAEEAEWDAKIKEWKAKKEEEEEAKKKEEEAKKEEEEAKKKAEDMEESRKKARAGAGADAWKARMNERDEARAAREEAERVSGQKINEEERAEREWQEEKELAQDFLSLWPPSNNTNAANFVKATRTEYQRGYMYYHRRQVNSVDFFDGPYILIDVQATSAGYSVNFAIFGTNHNDQANIISEKFSLLSFYTDEGGGDFYLPINMVNQIDLQRYNVDWHKTFFDKNYYRPDSRTYSFSAIPQEERERQKAADEKAKQKTAEEKAKQKAADEETLKEERLKYFGFRELTRDIDRSEIKKRYYRLAKKLHPDNRGDEEEFKKMKNHYDDIKKYLGIL